MDLCDQVRSNYSSSDEKYIERFTNQCVNSDILFTFSVLWAPLHAACHVEGGWNQMSVQSDSSSEDKICSVRCTMHCWCAHINQYSNCKWFILMSCKICCHDCHKTSGFGRCQTSICTLSAKLGYCWPYLEKITWRLAHSWKLGVKGPCLWKEHIWWDYDPAPGE